MKKEAKGFILFMTLMMILLLSMLLLTRMQELLLYSKLISAKQNAHQNFYEMEAKTLQLLQKNPQALPRKCLHEMDEPNVIFETSKKGGACVLSANDPDYLYYIEDLGEQACLTLPGEKGLLASHHWRYTLIAYKDKQPHSALQLRVIKPGMPSNCQGGSKGVLQGISSWRYLSDLNESGTRVC